MRGPIGRGKATAHVGGELAARGTLTFAVERLVIGSANGARIGITGLGVHVPERVMTNDELAKIVDTSDEWIVERTGIRERRIAAAGRGADRHRAARRRAQRSSDAGVDAADDRPARSCATVTPDMMFPTTSALLADALGMPRRRRLRPARRLHRLHVRDRAGVRDARRRACRSRALVVGGDVLSKILDWDDRSTLVLFGDGAGAVVIERVDAGGFLGFELGADGGGGEHSGCPGSGSRHFERRRQSLREDERPRGVQVRDARARLVGGDGARRVREDGRRRRRLRPAPGEQADHRPRGR